MDRDTVPLFGAKSVKTGLLVGRRHGTRYTSYMLQSVRREA
jgi:hypothetical protein